MDGAGLLCSRRPRRTCEQRGCVRVLGCRAVKRHRGRVEKRGSVPDAALSQEARPSSTDLGPSEVADAEAED